MKYFEHDFQDFWLQIKKQILYRTYMSYRTVIFEQNDH